MKGKDGKHRNMAQAEWMIEGNLKSKAPEEFLKEYGHVISLVGAGGKTSSMYALAEYFSRSGFRSIAMTTTHIWKPQDMRYVKTAEEVKMRWDSGNYAVIGTECTDGKLSIPENELYEWCKKEADVILIEADGSKGMPCKVPKESEPVIVPECDTVIGVIGMSCLGEKLKDVCFRKEKAMELLGVSENHRMTEDDLVQIIISENGLQKSVDGRKYIQILNQCDTEEIVMYANKITEKLKNFGIDKIWYTKHSTKRD